MKLDSGFLYAQLLWGSIGMGYFIYGKKQAKAAQMFGGILLVAASYFLENALAMSGACIGLIIGIHLMADRVN